MTSPAASPHEIAALHALLAASGPMTVGAMGQRIGVGLDEAGRIIDSLGLRGCRFDRHPLQGLTLIETGLACWADYIEARHAGGFGRKAAVFTRTASTQDIARGWIRSATDPRALEGWVVLADDQARGRGRRGRTWRSRPGQAVLLTAIHHAPEATVDRLMLASVHAVAETVERLTGRDVRTRWPNDVYIGPGKLAGILVERLNDTAMIGVGLNVAPVEPEDGAGCRPISLAELTGPTDRLAVVDCLLSAMDAAIHQATGDELLVAWHRRADLLEQRVTVDSAGRRLTGRVLGLDPHDGLVLAVEGGPTVTLAAATTSVLQTHGIS